MKQFGRSRWKKATAALAALCMLALGFYGTAHSVSAADVKDAEAVWWNARNATDNNAVTDRPAPTRETEAWERWSVRFGTGFGASPTPPVLVNGKVYTAAGNKIYELDRETGETLRKSEDLPMASSYGMNPPLYAEGKLFVTVTNSHICAINLDDLSLAWTTAAYSAEGSSSSDSSLVPAGDVRGVPTGQMNSPLSYVKIGNTGYVYTGTRTTAGGDFICATTDDSGVSVNANGVKVKALSWHFDPGKEDAENLAAQNCTAAGFYWSGAYASERFLAVGTDNGTAAKDTADATPFYTLNPVTGEIIDAVYGIKGAVRSTVVYRNGALYFVSKEAVLYKILVDADGYLGAVSSIDLKSKGVSSSSATPVLYGGRIYVGASGKGEKYSADGGHGIFVVRDDASLSDASFLYRIPVPGYPQMGALLSTAYEAEEGRVYLYFTYNAYPGGIFYTWDAPGQTSPVQLSAEESKLYIPPADKQQYCISSLAADADGTLYYKNDSGYLFAIEKNPAALLGMELKDSAGKAVQLDQPFAAKTADYTGMIRGSDTSVKLLLTPADGVSATVNGEAYPEGGMDLPLSAEDTQVEIRTEKEGRSRTYTLALHRLDANADLKTLTAAKGNTAPNLVNAQIRPLSPDFTPAITAYTSDWFATGTGGTDDPAATRLMNVFLKTDSPNATVQIYPESNVDPSHLSKDGTVKSYDVPGNEVYTTRYAVYSGDITHDSVIRIVVTAQDQTTVKEYRLTFNRRYTATDVNLDTAEADLLEGEELILSAEVFPAHATDHSVTWSTSDAAVAEVDENGVVFARGEGTAQIMAQHEDGPEAACLVRVTAHHTLAAQEEVPATVLKEGRKACYVCETCGHFFRDAAGEEELSLDAIRIPKLPKAKNPITVKTKTKKASYKKKTVFAAGKAIVVTNAQGKVTYQKVKGNARIVVAKNGKITVKKGLKKGKTYSVKVKVSAAGDMCYKAGAQTVVWKVKIR